MLALVDVLFAVFSWIQITNVFFGRPASVHFEVYREYVRRGFGELLVVAVLTMMLILGLRWAAWKETRREMRILDMLSTLMIALAIVILVSAFQRLLRDAKAGQFDVIVTDEWSRLSRQDPVDFIAKVVKPLKDAPGKPVEDGDW